MGTTLSRRLFQHRSKSNVNHHCQSTVEKIIDSNDVPSKDVHFFEELVPERYLVLLTEQMSAMLFRLITSHEISIGMLENESDQQEITNLDENDDESVSVNPLHDYSSTELQTTYQVCMKCRMKLLTMEEFGQFHQAFHRIDHDHDHYLTRDEIRTILNHLFELTESDIEEFLSVFDRNDDARVSLEEYIDEMKHRLLHEYTREEMKLAFDRADLQKNGHLSFEELQKAISYLNLHLPHQRIIEIVDSSMKNKLTDSIDFIFFTNIIKALHRHEPITFQKFKSIRGQSVSSDDDHDVFHRLHIE